MAKKSIIKVVCLCFIVAIIATTMVACGGPKTIDINQYVEFEFVGWNGYSKAVATINYEKLFNENKDLFDFNQENQDEADTLFAELQKSLRGEVDKYNGNKNGDEVTYKWDNNVSAIEEKYKVKFSFNDIKVTVKGLPELEEVDVFDNVTVKFTGKAPFGFATLETNSSEVSDEFTFSIDKTEGLSNDNKITITANIEMPNNVSLEDYFGWKGYKIKSTTKEIVVSGLETIVTDEIQIPETEATAMQQYVIDTKLAAFEESDIVSFEGMKCIGTFIFTKKTADAVTDDNVIYYIYEITMTINATGEKVTYYIYGKYNNVILDKDGKANVDVTTCKMPEASSMLGMIFGEGFLKGDILVQGFESYEAILNACKEVNSAMEFATNITKE